MKNRIRVLVAKPGLDGHDRGALVVAQGLKDEGMEVIYSGLRQTPEQIVAIAIQEDVDCIGLSILSGAHNDIFPEVTRLLREENADDILVIGGGIIPDEDIAYLKQQGISEIFTPGTPISDIANYIRKNINNNGNKFKPNVKKIDHIGIAVKNLKESIDFYQEILGLKLIRIEEIESEGVNVAFFEVGDTMIELLEPIDETSVIYKHIEKRGEGVHHLAYEVDEINNIFVYMKEKNINLLQDKPRGGANNQKIGFIHPKETHGVLTEFVEKNN